MAEETSWGWWNPDPLRRRWNVLASIAWGAATIAFFAGVGAGLQARTQLLMGGVGTDSLAYLVTWAILALMAMTIAAAAGVAAVLLSGAVAAKEPPSTPTNDPVEALESRTP